MKQRGGHAPFSGIAVTCPHRPGPPPQVVNFSMRALCRRMARLLLCTRWTVLPLGAMPTAISMAGGMGALPSPSLDRPPGGGGRDLSAGCPAPAAAAAADAVTATL